MEKTIHSNDCGGFLGAQMKTRNSFTVVAKLPKNAKIENIRLIGKVETCGYERVNPILEDLDGAVIIYHKERVADEVATVYFFEGLPKQIYLDIAQNVLQEFEIEYTEVCPCCGK